MTLSNDISGILGVVPPAPTAWFFGHLSGWAPPRPTPQYEFEVKYSRKEYGSVVVVATSANQAEALAEGHEIYWTFTGDAYCDEVEQHSDTPLNVDEIAQWEATYGEARYDPEDGQPCCSSCGDLVNHADALTPHPSQPYWYCHPCAKKYGVVELLEHDPS